MCIESNEKKERKRMHSRIERTLKENKARARKQVILLLLGTGESGKSTFMKQMRIIHDNGFNQSELEEKRRFVFQNTIQCMQLILQAMKYLKINIELKTNENYCQTILNTDVSFERVNDTFQQPCLSERFVVCIEMLWNDPGVQRCYEQRDQYQLSDSAEYFFNNVKRFGEYNYIPTNDDIVRIRLPTTGIHEHMFNIKSTYLRIVDVGGQSSERRKWINCFECVTSIIFITALNEYDMFKHRTTNIYNDSAHDQLIQLLQFNANKFDRINRMEESLALFKTITSIDILRKTSVILFLNKTDLLEEKIKRSPLKNHFPNYNGPLENGEEAKRFIDEMFRKNACVNKTIYSHFTCATDTENIKKVFDSVKDTILNQHIDEVFLNQL